METQNQNIEDILKNLYSLNNTSILEIPKDEGENENYLNIPKNNKEKYLDEKKEKYISEMVRVLDNILRNNISTYLNTFEVYRQKLLADKMFLLNSLDKNIKSLTINQLIELLTSVKNDYKGAQNVRTKVEKINNISEKIFNLLNNNSNNHINNGQTKEEKKKEKVYDLSKYQGIDFSDPTKICHSPSPLIFKKNDSKKIIEENKSTNYHIDFSTPQKIGKGSQ